MDKYTILDTNAVLAFACLILNHLFPAKGFLLAGFILLFLGLFFQGAGKWIAKIWLGFGEKMGHVVSSVLLGICFYFFLTPISFLYRIFNHDSLGLKKSEDKKSSYFHDRSLKFDQRYFEKIW